MKVTGIIVEYNPFHNGHAYHISQARKLTEPDVLVAVCSGNYTQRGDLSICDKFAKTEAALNHGIDLVVELPYIHTLQNAYVFGEKAVQILKNLKVDHLVFGSETNNLEELKKYAELEIDVTRLKQLLHDGNSFPKAYGLLSGALYPNDMLAVAYLKALKDSDIIPLSIQRTNGYHDENLDVISSATAIRKALKEGKDISKATPIKIENPVYNEDLYPYFRRLMHTRNKEELEKIFLVDEGIGNMLKDNALEYQDYEQFISASISRRYTRSRIQRTMCHIMNNITKKEVAGLPDSDHIRVLGFNSKGQELLRQLKDQANIVTQFKNIPDPYKQIEWKTSLIYSSLLEDQETYLKKELKGPIIR